MHRLGKQKLHLQRLSEKRRKLPVHEENITEIVDLTSQIRTDVTSDIFIPESYEEIELDDDVGEVETEEQGDIRLFTFLSSILSSTISRWFGAT